MAKYRKTNTGGMMSRAESEKRMSNTVKGGNNAARPSKMPNQNVRSIGPTAWWQMGVEEQARMESLDEKVRTQRRSKSRRSSGRHMG